MAKLVHPNIVPLFDTGTWDGRPYFVMPFVDGESLADRIARVGPLPEVDVIALARELCDALEYAHSVKIVHRDVKPSNVLIHVNGHAMLSDFGVARWLELTGEDRPTRSSAGAPGTISYASPEQAAGDRHLDGRSDIFSLGCLMYEALTTELPFTGSSARDSLLRRLAAEAPTVATRRPDVSEGLSLVIATALRGNAEDRWQSAREMAEALPHNTATHHASKSARAPSWAPGTIVAGRYTLTTILRTDATGCTSVAVDRRIGRHVVVKMYVASSGSSLGLTELLGRLDGVAALQHPHVLPCLEVAREGECVYSVHPLIKDGNLIDGSTLTSGGTARLCRVARQACEALQFVHDRQQLHLNVKPTNLLLSGDNLFLADLDFLHGTAHRETRRGATDPHDYCSPEHRNGGAVDRRADVFSLGRSLRVALVRTAGTAPERAQLDRVLDRACSIDPNERWSRVSEMASALPQ